MTPIIRGLLASVGAASLNCGPRTHHITHRQVREWRQTISQKAIEMDTFECVAVSLSLSEEVLG